MTEEVLSVTDAGETFEVELAGDRVVFGRLETCDVVLADDGVSREHAVLEREGSGWVISDLGSRNGTFVNDEPVDRRRVRPGDRIRIGTGVILEWIGPAPAPAPERAPARASAGAERAIETGPEPGAGPAPRRAAGPGGWFVDSRWRLLPRAAGAAEVTLRAAVTTVGRDPGAGLVLDDESVSRMHARLDRDGEGLLVVDLKSRNGTRLNDESVLRAPVRDGDTLRFGDVEFRVGRQVAPAWRRIGLVAGAAALAVVAVVGALRVSDALNERATVAHETTAVRARALEAVRAGIAASREGDAELARAHLLYASDLLLLSDLAPRGASLKDMGLVFGGITRDLPPDEREFDFARALDPATIEASQARLATLTNREYVEHQVRRYSVELGQDPDVPPEFVDQVWDFVAQYQKYPGQMAEMLRRAAVLRPRIRAILAQRHLPEAFDYVAWVESGLDSTQRSSVGALGLWQLMPATAREYRLHVDESDPMRDERTNVARSTAAAADYFATLLRDQGPEYFMLVLASYNRGHNALTRAKQKITDPMLRSTHKYWYLVENQLLPEETRNYVPKIFAVRVVAEAPERFGFTP